MPISVYRELAAELQATQAMMDSLNAQNQQLVQQNQNLRQEVAKVLQSTENLQKVFISLDSASQVREVSSPKAVRQPEVRPPAPTTPPVSQPRSTANFPSDELPTPPQPPEPPRSPYRETLVIEQEETPSPSHTSVRRYIRSQRLVVNCCHITNCSYCLWYWLFDCTTPVK